MTKILKSSIHGYDVGHLSRIMHQEKVPLDISRLFGLPQTNVIETVIYNKYQDKIDKFLLKQYKEFLKFMDNLNEENKG